MNTPAAQLKPAATAIELIAAVAPFLTQIELTLAKKNPVTLPPGLSNAFE
jgi:hypothetical protein